MGSKKKIPHQERLADKCWRAQSRLHSYPMVILFTNPSARAGYDTRSIFKRSLTGLNSEFSFSYTSCLTKAVRTQSALLFAHSWRENNWIHTFPKGISAMWNAICLVQDLNSSRRVHFLRYITITLRAPPLVIEEMSFRKALVRNKMPNMSLFSRLHSLWIYQLKDN